MVFVSLQGVNIATKKTLRRLQPWKRFSSCFTCNNSLVLAANWPVSNKTGSRVQIQVPKFPSLFEATRLYEMPQYFLNLDKKVFIPAIYKIIYKFKLQNGLTEN